MEIKNLLIANRGMPAIKFIASIKEWMSLNNRKIKIYCIATEDDFKSKYKYIAEAENVIFSENINIYKSINDIIDICKLNNIQAVWPGWGYLSEEPEFSKALSDNNIIFIGPSSYSLELLGDKVKCMELADKIKIPQLEWSHGCSSDKEFLKYHANRIGFPVILKSSNGGGGKGIRIYNKSDNIDELYNQIKAEATGDIFVMKLAKESKHLEVQIVSDGDKVITLGTRDCSTQRRRQKLIEEAPASFPNSKIIKSMEESAIKIVKEVGLKGVCTVEFLLEGNDNLSFMEVNPRLQVEHIVTETIYNVNLPSIQIMLAEGKKIDEIFPTELQSTGHAISCRINSEDAYNSFQPLTGKIKNISFNCIRNTWAYFSINDNGVINESADNQFGHIVAWGETREIARFRMIKFLSSLLIKSEMTNTGNFLKIFLENEKFINQKHDVTLLDKITFNQYIEDETIILCALISKAYNLYYQDKLKICDLKKNGHHNLHNLVNLEYQISLLSNNIVYSADINFEKCPEIKCKQNGKIYKFNIREDDEDFYLLLNNHKILWITINYCDNYTLKLSINNSNYKFNVPLNPNDIRAIVGGKILNFNYSNGDFVNKGDIILTIEIMKMSVAINSPQSGTLDLFVDKNQKVEKNDLLFHIENTETQIDYSNAEFKKLDQYKITESLNKETILKSSNQFSLSKQELASQLNTTYIYDLLEMFDAKAIFQLLFDDKGLCKTKNFTKDFGMIAFEIELKNNIKFILIANDITINVGSFSWKEDIVFLKASQYARINNLPRIYISSNSGAQLDLNYKVKDKVKIKWIQDNPELGFEFLYLEEENYNELKDEVEIEIRLINNKKYLVITAIKNEGVKNLNGSAMIASETSKSFEENFTLTYVTGRSVGIGAYLTKLGYRTIQKKDSPIILTGNVALNKVLGKKLYSNNNEIGGANIMSVNSTSHLIVNDDQEGVNKIKLWLSYLKFDIKIDNYLNPIIDSRIKYNSIQDYLNIIFDKEERLEFFKEWGASIIGGKARIHGFPITFLASNDVTTTTTIPVDPGNEKSKIFNKINPSFILNNDASQKVAQLIKESNVEKMPTLFLVNLRGFSGGTQDLLDQVLTHGSDIVRNLQNYQAPFYLYVLPNAQLRGGAMVVISKYINPTNIEIYSSKTANINILEPSALKSIKYKNNDIIKDILKNGDDVNNPKIVKNYQHVALQYCILQDKNTEKFQNVDGFIEINEVRDFFGNKIKNYYQNIHKK